MLMLLKLAAHIVEHPIIFSCGAVLGALLGGSLVGPAESALKALVAKVRSKL